MARDVAKLVALAGVPSGETGGGTLASEPVVVLRGAWGGNLVIFDRAGRPIGDAVRPDPRTFLRTAHGRPFGYTFSDTEDRFELRAPIKGPPGTLESLRKRGASRDPDRACTLWSVAGVELARLNAIEHVIQRDGVTVARFPRCSRRQRIGRGAGAQWRVVDAADTELTRVTFLRWRNLRYVANKFLVLGALKDRVNYVVSIAQQADAIDRSVAIALAVIADAEYVEFKYGDDDEWTLTG